MSWNLAHIFVLLNLTKLPNFKFMAQTVCWQNNRTFDSISSLGHREDFVFPRVAESCSFINRNQWGCPLLDANKHIPTYIMNII